MIAKGGEILIKKLVGIKEVYTWSRQLINEFPNKKL